MEYQYMMQLIMLHNLLNQLIYCLKQQIFVAKMYPFIKDQITKEIVVLVEHI